MSITPQPGYMIDPNNSNGVVKIGDVNPQTGVAYGSVPTATPQGTLVQSPTGGASDTPTIVPYNNGVVQSTVPANPNSVGPGNLPMFSTNTPSANPTSTGPSTSVDLTPVGGTGSILSPNAIPLSQFSGYNLTNGNQFSYQGKAYIVNGQYVTGSGLPASSVQDISIYAPTTSQSTPPVTAPSSQVPPYTAPAAISSDNTQSTATTPYVQPTDTGTGTAADMSGLNATYQQQLAQAEQLGPQQQQESDLTKQIMALTTQDAGRVGAQNAANTANGVDSAQATINSLTATQKQNLDAYNASQLTDQQGEGVTTAVDQRQRDAVTKQYAIQSLATSSLIAAANGDLANAQLLANKAVAAVYDPIEAQIAAGKQNLALIANDPATTAEEKAQADAVTAILNAQSQATAQAKTNATAIQNIAVTAASYTTNFTPTAQFPTAAQALQAIQSATDPVIATQIAVATGLTKQVTPTAPNILGSASTGYYTYDPTTGQTTPISNPNPSSTPANDPVLSPSQVAELQKQGVNVSYGVTQSQAAAAAGHTTSTTAPTSGGYPSTVLQPGSTDTASVTALQNFLVLNGFMTQAQMNTGPGIYGPATTAAVAALQSKLGVDNTGAVGYFGPKTIAAINGTAAPKTATSTAAPKQTAAQTQSSGFDTINQILAVKNPTVGQTYVDSTGKITATGFTTLVSAALADGISRAAFLAQYNTQMFKGAGSAAAYGLSSSEATAYGFQ